MLRRAIAATMLLGTGLAQADEPGFYAGAGIGKVDVSDDEVGFNGNDTGFKIFGGYSLNKHFSIEAAYINLGKPDDEIFGTNVEIEGTAFNAAAVGTIPLNDKFSLYGRAGIIFWDAEASSAFASADDSGNDFAYGIGGALNVTPSAKLRLEWEAADIDGTDYGLVTLSVAWRF